MLSERASAKINLHLHVVGRRPDGYHLLDSLVVFAGAADALTVEPSDGLSLAVMGPFAAGLDGEADLTFSTAAFAQAETTCTLPVRRPARCALELSGSETAPALSFRD